ncbi:hypothetical protein ACFQY4_28380 [Catellatospora bangladeshensis]|uniref:hypothetical protein n=1 Tax=Catellatospora bangladeshensis TaxID=310355 RepID=UPI003607B4F3
MRQNVHRGRYATAAALSATAVLAAALLGPTDPASGRVASLANPVAGALGFNVFVAEDASSSPTRSRARWRSAKT